MDYKVGDYVRVIEMITHTDENDYDFDTCYLVDVNNPVDESVIIKEYSYNPLSYSQIRLVKKVKATELAKKMYPDKEEENGYLFI